MSNSIATEVQAVRRWRVRIDQRSDLVFGLRDYFRRLGVTAEVAGPALVELAGPEDPIEIEQYVASWSRVNGAPLHVDELGEPPAVAPAPRSGSPRLGTLLVNNGYLTDPQLAGALAEASATKDLLGIVLLRRGLIFEDELARMLSKQLAIPYVSVGRVGVNAVAARQLPPEVGEAAAAIPVRMIGDAVQVAFADPTDSTALTEVGRYLPRIELAVAELSDIKLAWRSITSLVSA